MTHLLLSRLYIMSTFHKMQHPGAFNKINTVMYWVILQTEKHSFIAE